MMMITYHVVFLVVMIYGCASVLGKMNQPRKLERKQILELENIRNRRKINHVEMRKNMQKRGAINVLEEPGLVPLILPTDGSQVPGVYIARLNIRATFETVQGILNVTSRRLDFASNIRFVIFEGVTESDLQVLRHRTDVILEIEADKKAKLEQKKEYCTPDYPAGDTWNLDRIDTNRNDDLFRSWGDGLGVDVYIVDSGVNANHEDFGGRVESGWHASYHKWTDATSDLSGHGTHVASIVGGTKYGVAKNVTLIPVRVCDRSRCRESDLIEGLQWVKTEVQRKKVLSVINISIGGPYSSTLNDALDVVINAGIPTTVAAGNDYKADACTKSPASVNWALTVGATMENDYLAPFSNTGGCVDLYAPGVNVYGAVRGRNSGAIKMNGTSQAAPHVAGVAAGLLQVYRDAGWLSEPEMLAVYYVHNMIPSIGFWNAVRGIPLGTNNRILQTMCMVI